MIRKSPLLCIALAAGVLLTGCASVNTGTSLNGQKLTTDGGEVVAHVNGSNWGIYLLPIIPLLTGDPENPGSGMMGFKDNVTVNDVVDMVTKKSVSMGASKTVDLTSDASSMLVWPMPPIFLKDVEVSGNAIK